MRRKWIKATRRKDFEPTSASYMCSDHFAEEAFDESKTSGFCSRRYLKADAVPSIFAFPHHFILKKVKTCKLPQSQNCPQSTAEVETTKSTDHVDVNSTPTSTSPKSINGPTIQYVGECVAKDAEDTKPNIDHIDVISIPISSSLKRIKAPTIKHVARDCSDHLVEEPFYESNTSGFCSRWYLKADAGPSVFVFPDNLAPKKVKTCEPLPTRKWPQSTAEVETTKSTDHIDVNSRPTSTSLKSINGPTIRYVGDCVAKDTDSLTDVKKKLAFVMSAYQLQQKRIKGLMQQCRRTNKRYITVKNALDELQNELDRKPDLNWLEITP